MFWNWIPKPTKAGYDRIMYILNWVSIANWLWNFQKKIFGFLIISFILYRTLLTHLLPGGFLIFFFRPSIIFLHFLSSFFNLLTSLLSLLQPERRFLDSASGISNKIKSRKTTSIGATFMLKCIYCHIRCNGKQYYLD